MRELEASLRCRSIRARVSSAAAINGVDIRADLRVPRANQVGGIIPNPRPCTNQPVATG